MKKLNTIAIVIIAVVALAILVVAFILSMQAKGCDDVKSIITSCVVPTKEQLKIVARARSEVTNRVRYDSSYKVISCPNGDVSQNCGACTDVVIRSLRAVDIDLQTMIHADYESKPDVYGGKIPDTNIDHRRCRNQMIWMRGHALEAKDWQAGDIVYWNLNGFGMLHTGVVSDVHNSRGRPLVIHNLGPYAVEDDSLTRWKIIGHYRLLTVTKAGR